MTLTEQLRKSYGGREDDFNSDSDDDTRPTNYGDYVESDGGREDDFNSDSDDGALVLISLTRTMWR